MKINNYTSTIESTPSKKAFQSLTQTSFSNSKTNNTKSTKSTKSTKNIEDIKDIKYMDKVINLFDNSIKGRFHVTLQLRIN